MKIVFIHFTIDVMSAYSHAIASLAGAVSQEGHEIALVVIRNTSFHRHAETILNCNPDVVCMSCMSNQWHAACSLARILKTQKKNLHLWVGGCQINAAPYSFLKSDFDAACYGEGEYLLPQALLALSSGRSFKNPSWLTKTSTAFCKPSVIYDIDALPLPMVDIFNDKDVTTYPSVMFSRGCPFQCSYCMSRLGGVGGQIRWKSVERSIEEIKNLLKHFSLDEIYFDDDTFLKNAKWVKQFLELYRNEVNLPFYCNAHPITINKEICELLALSGCVAIGIGIESGNERIRRDVLCRHISNYQLREAFDVAHSVGLKTFSFNIIGIPGETLEDLLETIKLNEEIRTDYVRVSIYEPYPGTPLGDKMGTKSMPKPYFNSLDKLEGEFYKTAMDWLDTLEKDGKLWND